MTTMETRPGIAEVVSKAAGTDVGTESFITDALLYEALCEELDRVDDALQHDARRIMAHEAKSGLEVLAKRYATASDEEKVELSKAAEHLYALVEISKAGTDDDPSTPYYDARDQGGRFRSKVLDALKLFAGNRDNEVGDKANSSMTKLRDGGRYQKARVLGDALQKLPSGEAQVAGRLARAVGDIGPEAEKVFGRGLTRLAYRYRGTERRAPEELRTAIKGQLGARTALLNRTDNGVAPSRQQIQLRDAQRLGVAGNQAALYLSKDVPDMDLARLSLAAGQLPPSRGVMIDAEGNPVSESMGVNGDHYLPFDLKNLKRLKGGQYVRTRTTGGLTDEDIYTGLLSGARQVQVISNSGVFTVEFDPALRGGRRYSDKARAMVKRYAAIVEQLANENVTAQDLPPREIARIKQEAFKRAGGNEVLAERYQKDDLDKARYAARFQEKSDEELWDEATVLAQGEMATTARNKGWNGGDSTPKLAQRQKELFNELKTTQREQTVRNYRLDAEGYDAAQSALKQEFPFFIRGARFEELGDFLDRNNALGDGGRPKRPGKDIGYTPRGGLRPGDKGARPAADKTTTAPQGGQAAPQAPSGAAAAAAPKGDPFVELLRSPTSPVQANLVAALDDSLGFFHGMADADKAVFEHTLVDKPDEAPALNRGVRYLSWLASEHNDDNRAIAAFLADPARKEAHLTQAVDGLKKLKAEARDDPNYDPKRFDDAIKALTAVQQARHPYGPPTANPALADPTQGPHPFPDIAGAAGDLSALIKIAENDPDAAGVAAAALEEGEEAHAPAIAARAKEISALLKWPSENGELVPDRFPQGYGPEHFDRAKDLVAAQAQNQAHPDMVQLEKEQRGLTLARTIALTAALTGEEVPKLPFGQAPVEKRGPRQPRVPVVKVHGPGTPAARALAARRSRSGS